MRLIALTVVVMVAFAANSVLNRMAVGPGHIGALEFSMIRALSGAVMLSALVLMQGRGLPLLRAGRAVGAGALALYLIGFSVAYVHIDAGIGALILFGGVQVTMFTGAVLAREDLPRRRWIGAALAMGGLGWLVWPSGAVSVPVIASVAMLLAAIGWGVYSLIGRRATDPLAESAANFVLAAPLCWGMLLLMPVAPEGPLPITDLGLILAVISGAVTSGLGYALWYAVLPRLPASVSGLVQLSVPIIAMIGGVILLNEALTARMVGAMILTLGGIAYGLGAAQMLYRTKSSNGS